VDLREAAIGAVFSALVVGLSVAYRDNDGDGYGIKSDLAEDSVTEVVYCDGPARPSGQARPSGYAWAAGHCDDTDPAIYRLFQPDRDGDGFGVEDEEPAVCSNGSPMAGYADVWNGPLEDCEDDDAAVNPWTGPGLRSG
jgi:hypothetical protein